MKLLTLALCVVLSAPFQCATTENKRPIEDTAPQALWILAERFEAEGNAQARETTLRQIVDQYPSSRYAKRAKSELGEPGSAAPAAPAEAAAPADPAAPADAAAPSEPAKPASPGP